MQQEDGDPIGRTGVDDVEGEPFAAEGRQGRIRGVGHGASLPGRSGTPTGFGSPFLLGHHGRLTIRRVSHKRPWWSTAVAAVITLGALPLVPARAAEPAGFGLDAKVRLVFVTVDVDASRLRPLVPPEFELVAPGGQATVGFASFPGTVSLDGGSAEQSTTTGVMALVQDPTGSNEGTFYDLWWGTPGAGAAAAFQGVGLAWELSPDVSYREQAEGPMVSVEADSPLTSAPHHFRATTHQPPGTKVFLRDRHYQQGEDGLVLTVYDHEDMQAAAAGVADVHVGAGSPLAQVLGATTRSGRALHFGNLRLIGRTEVVDPG